MTDQPSDVEIPKLINSTDSHDKKLILILSELEKAKDKLEWWQKVLIDTPHKDKEEVRQIVGYYAYQSAQIIDVLFNYLSILKSQ
jgi:hypothetical protein